MGRDAVDARLLHMTLQYLQETGSVDTDSTVQDVFSLGQGTANNGGMDDHSPLDIAHDHQSSQADAVAMDWTYDYYMLGDENLAGSIQDGVDSMPQYVVGLYCTTTHCGEHMLGGCATPVYSAHLYAPTSVSHPHDFVYDIHTYLCIPPTSASHSDVSEALILVPEGDQWEVRVLHVGSADEDGARDDEENPDDEGHYANRCDVFVCIFLLLVVVFLLFFVFLWGW